MSFVKLLAPIGQYLGFDKVNTGPSSELIYLLFGTTTR